MRFSFLSDIYTEKIKYVYYGKKMENIENPLSQIVNSIIGYLQTGKYKDTTGVAMVNKSPKQTSVQTPEPITGTTHNMQNNKTNKNETKNMYMNKKNTIRLTESDLKRVISESVKRVLKENEEKILKLQYDENLSRSRGRKYYYCHNNGRYYTNIEGEWYICTDNYYLEPDVHLDDNVRVITESVKRVLKENEDGFVSSNPKLNQLWNELMRIQNGTLKDIISEYGWGGHNELGDGVFRHIMAVRNAISTLDAVIQKRTADSDYWAMDAHEQD